MPAWATLPVAYNGRASSVAVSGTPVIRPRGQIVPPGSSAMVVAAEPMLDFELEFGAWLGGPVNALGETVDMARADRILFGCCLVNDWSARAIQFYEMLLGPHLGKSFLTTISPWVVTMEALAPFRVPGRGRDADQPEVPGYLDEPFDRAWRRVGLALDRVGFTVEDRDRAKGFYFVRYVDPERDAEQRARNQGFFSRLFSFQVNPEPAAVTIVPNARFAITFDHGSGVSRSPSRTVMYSRPSSVKPPRPFVMTSGGTVMGSDAGSGRVMRVATRGSS